jgi:TolB-like protein
MVTLILWGVLAAAPNLAAPGLQCSGIDPALCDAYLEHFVSNLTNRGLTVTTKNDMAQIMGAERQRQLMGCTTESSACLAELTAALGVANLLTGTVAKTESGYVSTLKVLAAADGSTKWSATKRVDTEKELFVFLEEQAGALVGVVAPGAVARGVSMASPVVKWIPAMVGGVAAIVGGALLLASESKAALLRVYATSPDPMMMYPAKADLKPYEAYINDIAASGRELQVAGWVTFGLGIAAITSSIVWALLPSSPVTATVIPTAQDATFGLAMELP